MSEDSAWFLARTRVRMEYTARDSLIRLGFKVYLPVMAKDERKYDSGTQVMFQGYLPVYLTIGVSDTHKIKKAPGCVDLVRFGDHLARFPDGCIDNLKNGADIREVAKRFQPGDQIRVRSGLFHDLRGTMESIPSGDRADVLLDMFNCLTRVRMDVRELEPA